MVKIRTCTFCGGQIQPGNGIMFVASNGTISYFCSNKCRKFKIKYRKNPRKLRWTEFWEKKGQKQTEGEQQ